MFVTEGFMLEPALTITDLHVLCQNVDEMQELRCGASFPVPKRKQWIAEK